MERNRVVGGSKPSGSTDEVAMEQAEIIRRIVAYFDEAEKGQMESGMGSGYRGFGAVIQSIVSGPELSCTGLYNFKVLVKRNARAVEYEPTIKGDEGWSIEEGTFYSEEFVSVPSFVLSDDFWELDLGETVAQLRNDIRKRFLKEEIEANLSAIERARKSLRELDP